MIHNRKFNAYFVLILLLTLISSAMAFGIDSPVLAKNIEFVNADLRDVFRSLAEAGEFNVVLDQTVHGEVTLTLKYGVTIKDAVSVIAKTYGYNCRWLTTSSTVVIGNTKFLDENFGRKFSKVFQLNLADPSVVAGSLEVVVPKTSIKSDLKTNQITVLASEVELLNVAEIISRLDRELPMINIEAKIEEVTDQFWKEIAIDNIFSPPYMSIYLLTEQQLKKVEENLKNILLLKPNLTSLDSHEGKIFIGDKVPIVTEKNKQGDINYQVEYLDAGSSLSIIPRINDDNKLTIRVKLTVSTLANKSQAGANWVPWVVTREFESTIRLESGQAFVLSGLLQRSEYNMMKDSPYKFPVLSELFNKENGGMHPTPGSRTEVIILLKPKFMGRSDSDAKVEDQTTTTDLETVSRQNKDQNTIEESKPVLNEVVHDKDMSSVLKTSPLNQTASVLPDKPLIEEEKPIVIIDLKSPMKNITKSQTTVTIKNDFQLADTSNQSANQLFKEVSYTIKKGDSLASIVRKFGSDLQMVVERNKLGKTGSIKPNAFLIIPVPSGRIYILKPKETMWRIAKRYGTSLAVLKDLNGIADETKVKAGQEIVLPVLVNKIINPQF